MECKHVSLSSNSDSVLWSDVVDEFWRDYRLPDTHPLPNICIDRNLPENTLGVCYQWRTDIYIDLNDNDLDTVEWKANLYHELVHFLQLLKYGFPENAFQVYWWEIQAYSAQKRYLKRRGIKMKLWECFIWLPMCSTLTFLANVNKSKLNEQFTVI